MRNRLFANWVYGGVLAGLLLLLLAPLLTRNWPAACLATYICLPTYMLHQYEEHENDRFRRFVNHLMGDREVLTPFGVFMINIPGVWGVIAVALWLSVRVGPGYGLIASYLLLLNGAAHIGQGIALRRYNPGLVTSILFFLPIGVWSLVAIQHSGAGTLVMHLIGAGSSLLIHAAIIAYALHKAHKLA
ncbi:MAG: HXXEE domain-containing protein [Acidobacteriota bacterium]